MSAIELRLSEINLGITWLVVGIGGDAWVGDNASILGM